jgi:hypothetical protein
MATATVAVSKMRICVVNNLSGDYSTGKWQPMCIWFSRRNIHEPKKIPYNVILFDTVLPARPASLLKGK